MATVIIQFCNRCEERKYLKLCKKCLQYLCSDCKREHFCGVSAAPPTIYSSSEHLIKSIDNKPFQCRTHLKEVVRFCFTCTLQLCEECLDNDLSQHKNHVIYNVDNAAKEIRRQTDEKIASLKVKIEKARRQRHDLDKQRFSSTDRQNTRRQVTNLASNLASAIVAAIEDQARLDKTVAAESVTKLQKTIDVWTETNRTLHKISTAPHNLENIHLFCKYIKVHENLDLPSVRTRADFPDDRKFQHSELVQTELRSLVEYLEALTGINVPLPVKTQEEIERLATAYDREITMVDLATNPASRPQSRVSIKTNMTSTTMLTKYEEDSIMYIKSENQALKMELSKLRKQTKEMIHAASLLSNYCTNVMQFSLMQEDDILEALRKPMVDDDELSEFYHSISSVGHSFSKLKTKVLNVESTDMGSFEDLQNNTDDTKSIQTRMTIETVANHSIAETVSTTIHDKVSELPPISQKSSRPNSIIYMYSKLYDNEWSDALDTLTQSGKRWAMDLVIKHLYLVIKACYKICKHIEEQQLQDLIDTVFLSNNGRRLPLTDIKAIMDLRRRIAVDTAINIRQNIPKMDQFQSELTKCTFKKDKLLKQIYDTPFYGKCVYLCWCMTLEEPPLCLDKEPPKGSVFDKDLYREFTKGGKRIEYCVWPPLLLKEDGEILVKGIVQAR